MAQAIRILMLEDSPLEAELAIEHLRRASFHCAVRRAEDRNAFVEALEEGGYDLILADYTLPGFDISTAFAIARDKAPDAPFLILSDAIGEETVAELLKRGVADYLLKDRLYRLPDVVQRALAEARARSERDWAMQALRDALADKESLLAEVHHRVRNNFQVIASLLRLQMARLNADTQGRDALQDTLSRVESMALVHDVLYRTNQASRLDFVEYLRHLGERIAGIFGFGRERLHLRVEGASIAIGLQQAVPAGLLVNELIANVFRHALAPDGDAHLSIDVAEQGGSVLVTVRDKGPGLPQAVLDGRASGFGLRLIDRLAGQLGGTVSYANRSGAVVEVHFPLDPIPGGGASAA